VATLSSRVQGSAKEAAKLNHLNEKNIFCAQQFLK
jgi:hypothetical protein